MMVLDVVFLQILVIEDGNKPSLHDQTLEWDVISILLANMSKLKLDYVGVLLCKR